MLAVCLDLDEISSPVISLRYCISAKRICQVKPIMWCYVSDVSYVAPAQYIIISIPIWFHSQSKTFSESLGTSSHTLELLIQDTHCLGLTRDPSNDENFSYIQAPLTSPRSSITNSSQSHLLKTVLYELRGGSLLATSLLAKEPLCRLQFEYCSLYEAFSLILMSDGQTPGIVVSRGRHPSNASYLLEVDSRDFYRFVWLLSRYSLSKHSFSNSFSWSNLLLLFVCSRKSLQVFRKRQAYLHSIA